MNPGMPAAVVHRRSWCRKVRVRESTHRDADRLADALLGVKYGRPADGTEPEDEPRSLIANTNIFGPTLGSPRTRTRSCPQLQDAIRLFIAVYSVSKLGSAS